MSQKYTQFGLFLLRAGLREGGEPLPQAFQYLNVLWANVQLGHFLNPKQTLHQRTALAQNRGFLALFGIATSNHVKPNFVYHKAASSSLRTVGICGTWSFSQPKTNST